MRKWSASDLSWAPTPQGKFCGTQKCEEKVVCCDHSSTEPFVKSLMIEGQLAE